MKKSIVFVIPSLDAGGGEKSLVNLLNCIDFNQYEVDLILLNKKGIFLKSVPAEVNILELNEDYLIFTKNIKLAIVEFIKKGKLKLAFSRFMYALKLFSIQNSGIAEQRSWKYIVKSIKLPFAKYDAAVGFLEKSSIYFIIDCIEAKKKIGFIHNDYNKLNLDASIDEKYFRNLDVIATVSEECATVLKERFPDFLKKIKVIYNIVSEELIHKLALEKANINKSVPIILSIGRLHPQKGFDLAIDAALILKENNIHFQWLVIGEGEQRMELTKRIKEKGLEKNFILLGLKENPYPYLKAATVYVQPSKYEGKSIAIDEAKILNKPIIVTNFSTAKDQIQSNVNGIITEMKPDALAIAISNLLDDNNLQTSLAENLSKEKLGTEDEINKIYQLINE
ncbi:glycosyltransferase [Flavobacterium flavipallidum]|uniref:Glycosyltransferase n=1 Tax=Flavobacterium flavipallidum TaxID=3139140 RepID=A0ABU9HJ12_9FLAO